MALHLDICMCATQNMPMRNTGPAYVNKNRFLEGVVDGNDVFALAGLRDKHNSSAECCSLGIMSASVTPSDLVHEKVCEYFQK